MPTNDPSSPFREVEFFVADEPLSTQAYYRILQCLLDQSLPTDKRISESALAKQLGISRTPVREAINRLESEGYLYQIAGSGTFRAEPDRQQLIEAYEVREALEGQAAAKATLRMTPSERVELKLQCDNMHTAIRAMRDSGDDFLTGEPLKQYLVADLKFHLLLLRAANNRTVLKIVTDRRIRDCAFGDTSHHRTLSHVSQVWLVHARIARAVGRKNPKAARYWMRQHIRSSRRDALIALKEWQTTRTPRSSVPSEVSALLEEVVKQTTVPPTPKRRS